MAGMNCVTALHATLQAMHEKKQLDYATQLLLACLEPVRSGLTSLFTMWLRTVATNIFEKQNGEWKLVLHQGGPLPTASGI